MVFGRALPVILLVLSACVVDTTRVKNCKGQRHGKMLDVSISACEAPPCLLKKGTKTQIEIKFIPKNDVSKLRNHVTARLAGINLPFVGVDGSDACVNVYQADGQTKAGCPLKAGTEYVYKNGIDVLPVYPTVNPLVHWALQGNGTRNDVACFEIQSMIH